MMRGVSSLTIAASGGRAQAASWAEGASGCVWLGLGAGSIVGPGRGVVGSFSEPEEGVRGGRDWAAARGWGVVTQNPGVECITRAWLSQLFACGCGDGGKFCDANGSILRTPPEVPKVCGAPTGRAAGFWNRRFEVSIGWTRSVMPAPL